MIKNIRIWIWVFFILISILLIGPNPNPQGIRVNYINRSANINNIAIGDIILEINDEPATLDMLQKSYIGTVKILTNKGVKYIDTNGSIGISGEKVESSNIKFGLDIKGGIRAVIKPNTTNNITIQQVISTLQTRINVFGLRETKFRPMYSGDEGFIEISIAGGSKEHLTELLEAQGNFEAKIPLSLEINGVLKLDKDYELRLDGDTLYVNDLPYRLGEEFELAGIKFTVDNITNNNVKLTSLVFTGEDIKTVYYDPRRSRIEPYENGVKWSFGVQLSTEGAQKFAWVTQNLHIMPGGYLDSQIYLYLDGKLIDSLNIASGLKGKTETEIAVTGGARTIDEAVEERTKLQSILRSGALPTSIEIVQLETISPNLGSDFLKSAALAGLAAIVGVIIIVLIRYRKIKFALPMIFVSLSEVLIILGLSTAIGWTIDLAAIAGIIAAVGTGIDSQIIILDQSLRGERYDESLKQKLKRAFFIIFGAGGTTIMAMLPLMALGFGAVRGFAIVTIIGVLVGILITRPAFGAIVEKLVR